jgi:hypothetical protein
MSTERRLAAAAAGAAVLIAALTGCGVPAAGCVVRHQYAIVLFQNDLGANARSYVTSFRLNVRYGPRYVMHLLMHSSIKLPAGNGGAPPVVVRTYAVGLAHSCSVSSVQERQ